jgi:Holliday junction DNA helicase, RuvA subunit
VIGHLRGTLLHKQAPSLLLDVQGVGYELQAPMSTFYQLPPSGSEVALYTHLLVREDAHTLFGFATPRERSLFRVFIKVNGIGPKLALAILSGISPDAFVRCVQENDCASLVRLPGIGKKTAERLIMEMRNRFSNRQGAGALETGALSGTGAIAPASPTEDAVSALVALGYKHNEANRMVCAVASPELDSEELIRRALKAAVK